jgi:hypothetical protein
MVRPSSQLRKPEDLVHVERSDHRGYRLRTRLVALPTRDLIDAQRLGFQSLGALAVSDPLNPRAYVDVR